MPLEDAAEEFLLEAPTDILNELIEKEMISPALSYCYSISKTSAYNSLAGESDHPRAVLEYVTDYLKRVEKEGLSESDFQRGKRVMYAEFVKAFDSTDSIANNLFSFVCEDSELLSYADLLEQVTYEEVCDLFQTAFRPEATALSVVLPLKESNNQ